MLAHGLGKLLYFSDSLSLIHFCRLSVSLTSQAHLADVSILSSGD